jgi:hypothetical protein
MSISGAPDLDLYVLSTNADWREAKAIEPASDYAFMIGSPLQMDIRRSDESPIVVLEYLDVIRGTDNEAGEPQPVFVVNMPVEQIRKVPPGDYIRDVRVFWGGSTIYLGRGPVQVKRGVSREEAEV